MTAETAEREEAESGTSHTEQETDISQDDVAKAG